MLKMIKYLTGKQKNDICDAHKCESCPLNLHVNYLDGTTWKSVCMMNYESFRDYMNGTRLREFVDVKEDYNGD